MESELLTFPASRLLSLAANFARSLKFSVHFGITLQLSISAVEVENRTLYLV